MGAPVNPTFAQESYAFYSDGSESGATIIGSVDTQQTIAVDTPFHCRLAISDTVGANNKGAPLTLTLRLQYNHNSGGWTTVTGSTPVQYVDNANLTDGGATTNRQPTGTGTFYAGRVYESQNDGATCYSLPADETTSHTEAVFHLQLDSAQVSNGDEVLLRCVLGDGTLFGGTYVNADINALATTPTTVNANAGALSIAGQTAPTNIETAVSAAAAGLSLAAQQADTNISTLVSPSSQALSATANPAVILYGAPGVVIPFSILLSGPELLIPRRKPIRPAAINFSNPLTRGLFRLWLMETPVSISRSLYIVDLVQQGNMTITVESGFPRLEGDAIRYDATYGKSYHVGSFDFLNGYTVMQHLMGDVDAGQVLNVYRPWSNGTGTSESAGFSWDQGSANYARAFWHRNAAGGYTPCKGTIPMYAGEEYVVTCRWDGTDEISLWVDGVKDGSVTGISSVYNPTSGNFGVGNAGNLLSRFPGKIWSTVIWDRPLADDEMTALGRDPYQILRPS